ncbi:Eukaryotic translation initiation factor 3 subunit J, partial [Quaeritorhiza haematococci]
MSDWENEEFEDLPDVSVPVVTKGKWDDEDAEEDDVKDSWEDALDDDEKKEEEKTKATSPQPKKKKTLAQKIAEREEAERKRKEEIARKKAEYAEEDLDETPEERKLRLQRQVVESDFENAKALFGDLAIKGDDKFAVLLSTPTTKQDFDQFGEALGEKLSQVEKNKNYAPFIESLIRNVCASLSLEDIRKISATVKAIADEKQKAATSSKKKKGGGATGKKATLRSHDVDTTNYYDEDH